MDSISNLIDQLTMETINDFNRNGNKKDVDMVASIEYSISELIDKLTILNIKIFNCVDIIENEKDIAIVADNAKKAQSLNKQRSQVKNAIDAFFGKKAEELEIKI